MNSTPQSVTRCARLSLVLGCMALVTQPLSAQSVNATPAPDAKTLAKYDKNQNGKLDADELAAKQADDAKAASVPVASTPAAKEEVLELSPFEVSETNNGYYARNTMSGT